MDGVELEFEEEALDAIVDKAIERKTGARGLRSIIEEIMRDVMFEIPSNFQITKCTITKEVVTEGKKPVIEIDENKQKTTIKVKKKVKQSKAQETA